MNDFVNLVDKYCMSPKELLLGMDSIGRPSDEQIVGVMCVLQDFLSGEIFLARELMIKPQYDKTKFDYTLPAGGRDFSRAEDIWNGTLLRELREETQYESVEYVVDPVPIGWFQFTNTPNKPWIVAYRAFINHEGRLKKFAMPSDHETAFPIWVDPKTLDLDNMPLRGGMREVLTAYLKGETNVVRKISKANHLGKEGIIDPFPPTLIIDGRGTQRDVVWNKDIVTSFLGK